MSERDEQLVELFVALHKALVVPLKIEGTWRLFPILGRVPEEVNQLMARHLSALDSFVAEMTDSEDPTHAATALTTTTPRGGTVLRWSRRAMPWCCAGASKMACGLPSR